jgi:hypothetical protein
MVPEGGAKTLSNMNFVRRKYYGITKLAGAK